MPDLAERVEVSEDGLAYTFTLREDARFHNGEPVTASDVVFTVKLAQNPDVKSPKRPNWEGVGVEAIDGRTVQFTLAQPYAPFLENATMGILPEHRWENVPPEQHIFSTYNTEPIGSGPFAFVRAEKDSAGVPKEYVLEQFRTFALGAPYLERITLRFYPNEDELLRAFERGTVDNINSIGPERLATLEWRDFSTHTAPLPRVFGVFFNQDEQALFTSEAVRRALSVGIDRARIVNEVLGGYGTPIDGPLPISPAYAGTERAAPGPDYERARDLLERAGWELDEKTGFRVKETNDERTELRFTIATSNAPELQQVAELIRDEWAKLGVQVNLTFYETSTLNQEIIRPRRYDALLFGQIIGRDLDPFAFWHSSQRDDPGLNIALYANITADRALERIRTTFDRDELAEYYTTFTEEIEADVPTVFIYTPDFIYLTDADLKGIVRGIVTTPAERFLNVHEWHIYTQRVWGFLADTPASLD